MENIETEDDLAAITENEITKSSITTNIGLENPIQKINSSNLNVFSLRKKSNNELRST